ncbi:MAG: CocE/NonD family hydrolase [Fimbriimonadaceae bacterium]
MSPLAALALATATVVSHGEAPRSQESVRDRYEKTEVMVPMRDGTRLFTQIYAPRDTSRTYPLLMQRTPYGCSPYGPDAYRNGLGPTNEFMDDGYIFVYQDVRGRWMSEGEHVFSPPHKPHKTGTDFDESSDTYDTIEWLLANVANHNGRVGTYGISQPGFYVTHSLINSHPALKAASPQAPVTDRWRGDDDHHHGAFFLAQRVSFLSAFGTPRPVPTPRGGGVGFRSGQPDAYQFYLELGGLPMMDLKYFQGTNQFWNQVMAHPDYDDFWQSRDMTRHMHGVKPAVLVVGGWFDAENLFGALQTYKAIESKSPGANNRLMMGPWTHGSWSRGSGERIWDWTFGPNPSETYRVAIRKFFRHHLKDEGPDDLPEASVYETGGNRWHFLDQWPPAAAQMATLTLGPDRTLILPGQAPPPQSGSVSFVSDPNQPVPYFSEPSPGMNSNYMVGDQRFAASRDDVATFVSAPLSQDLTLVGPITADLLVSTSGTDSDWVVKLIDVLPAEFPAPNPNPRNVNMSGYQRLVRAEIMRGKYREDFAQPRPFIANEPTRVTFETQDLFHTFKAGHRVMVQIQCSWFPLVDRNPQKFMNIRRAWPWDFHAATQRVFWGPEATKLRVQTWTPTPSEPSGTAGRS